MVAEEKQALNRAKIYLFWQTSTPADHSAASSCRRPWAKAIALKRRTHRDGPAPPLSGTSSQLVRSPSSATISHFSARVRSQTLQQAQAFLGWAAFSVHLPAFDAWQVSSRARVRFPDGHTVQREGSTSRMSLFLLPVSGADHNGRFQPFCACTVSQPDLGPTRCLSAL